MDEDTVYTDDNVSVIQHGGSIYVTSGNGLWSRLKPTFGKVVPFLDRMRKDAVRKMQEPETIQAVKDYAQKVISGNGGKTVSGRGAYLELTPEQRKTVDHIKKSGPKRQVSEAQLEALARGREIRKAHLAAKNH